MGGAALQPGSVPVAIVDDHALVREGLVALLRARCPEVDIVFSGSDPEAALLTAPQVVLLDIDLGVHGADVLTTTRMMVAENIVVLLLSAVASPQIIRQALHAGAMGFVTKGADPQELSDALRAAESGEMFYSASLRDVLSSAGRRPALSAQEVRALRLYASGYPLADIAQRMGISVHTVREYLDRVRVKYLDQGLRVRTREELAIVATRDGFLHLGDLHPGDLHSGGPAP